MDTDGFDFRGIGHEIAELVDSGDWLYIAGNSHQTSGNGHQIAANGHHTPYGEGGKRHSAEIGQATPDFRNNLNDPEGLFHKQVAARGVKSAS